MAQHHPLTDSQRAELINSLDELKTRFEEIQQLVTASHPPESEPAIRSAEVVASIQRLQWALDRESNSAAT